MTGGFHELDQFSLRAPISRPAVKASLVHTCETPNFVFYIALSFIHVGSDDKRSSGVFLFRSSASLGQQYQQRHRNKDSSILHMFRRSSRPQQQLDTTIHGTIMRVRGNLSFRSPLHDKDILHAHRIKVTSGEVRKESSASRSEHGNTFFTT